MIEAYITYSDREEEHQQFDSQSEMDDWCFSMGRLLEHDPSVEGYKIYQVQDSGDKYLWDEPNTPIEAVEWEEE